MSKVSSYPANTFSWVDLTTPEQEKAKQFYSGLFDWTAEDMPVPGGGHYSIMKKDGSAAAAIAPPPPFAEFKDRSSWNSYVSVKDVDAMTKRATELGASIISAPGDVGEAGRMSIIADPQGAIFMLWQGKNFPGAEVVNEPGSLLWNELMTEHPNKSAMFYHELFGWTHTTIKMGEVDYHMFDNGGRAAGAMLEMADMPSWGVYFAVEDAGKSLELAEKLGAKRDMEMIEIPDTGKFVMLRDPVGAHFYIMQMEVEPTPL